MKLQMTDAAFDYAVRRTGENFMTNTGTPFSGDHLNALCRSVARIRLRDDLNGATTPKEVERGFNEYEEKVELTDKDAVMVATHEAGHFVCSLFCPHHPHPERVTIQSEMPWAPFYTGYKKNVMAPDEVLASINVPKATSGEFMRIYKISKRFDDDISAVCLAINMQIENGMVIKASIGVGGVAATE